MSQILPLVLQGHERPLTKVQFSRQGDLLFTAAKDKIVTMWYTDNGERLGVFRGHNGAVWSLDVSEDTTRLITGAGDECMKLWDIESGKELLTVKHETTVRSVAFALGDRLVASCTDTSFGNQPEVLITRLSDDIMTSTEFAADATHHQQMLRMLGHKDKISDLAWGPLNTTIFSAGLDGTLCKWDVETGKRILEVKPHGNKAINHIRAIYNGHGLMTASADHTAKILDGRTLEVVKTYESDTIVNDVDMSPIKDHVIVGGGQEARNVTTSAAAAGKFEVKFFHKQYSMELGAVPGHFGPINTLAFSADGRSFASGGEEGVVRLHHLPQSYFELETDA